MTSSIMRICGVPALLWGERCSRVFLYIHGQSGRKEEGERLARAVCPKGWQVLAIDLPGHGVRDRSENLVPWRAIPELRHVMDYMQERWHAFGLCGVSIGAWLSMQAFAGVPFERCLFISPLTDMKVMISHMMAGMSVSEEQLKQAGEITSSWGETLSWRYWQYACQHPIASWPHPTAVLCAQEDNVVGRATIDAFAALANAKLTVCPFGEHWFHTDEQLAFLNRWLDSETD